MDPGLANSDPAGAGSRGNAIVLRTAGLGFRTAGWWPRQFGGYAILIRGDLIMHFFAFADISRDKNYGQCYWRVQDVDALYAEVHAAGLPSSGTPRLAP